MPEERTYLVYKYNELSTEAKEKARDSWWEYGLEYEWWDCVFEDAKEIGARMGIEIENIYFSGFSRQGDGACFEGTYNYNKGSAKDIREYAPMDKELHRIAETLAEIQRDAFYGACATLRHTGRYSHEYSVSVNVEHEEGVSLPEGTEEAIVDCLRDFMRWIYRALETEYEYLNSDEVVEETIQANECEFNENGSFA